MRITAGSIAKRLKEVDGQQFMKEFDVLLGIKTRDNGSRYLDPTAERRITADSHSWSEIGEAVCGRELIQKMRDTPYGMTGGHAHTRFQGEVGEMGAVGGAMGPSQFAAINYWTGITFKVLESELLAQFLNPELAGDKLTTLKPGVITNASRRGRYSPPTTSAGRRLQPNEPIPMGSMNAEWIDTNPVEKNGQGLAIASETMLFDGNQGAAVTAIGNIGYQIAWNKEDKILKPVLGIHNTYKYGSGNNEASTAYNTYLSAAATGVLWQNDVAQELTTDETSLDVAEQLFLGMKNPQTGYPINIGEERDLLVMPFKKMTAARLQRNTSVQVGPRDTSGAAVMTTSNTWAGTRLNPIVSQRAFDLLQTAHTEPEASGWTPLTATQAKYRTVYGAPKRAFEYRETRPFQSWSWNMTQDPSLAASDCFMMIIALEQGSVTVVEPRHVLRMKKDS